MLNNKNKTPRIVIWFLVFSLIMPFFSGCSEKEIIYKVNLEIWGVFDDGGDYSEMISEYDKINPFINRITYRKFTVDNYKNDLINALAAGNGPDIFMINNLWMPEFEDKVAPAPDYLLNEQQFRSNFVDVVAEDFLGSSGEIYGTPLSVDSLALYYNKDLFNATGITSPPETWEELVEDSKKITDIDNIGGIDKSGVALGTAYNINRSSDIVELLLLQHGAQMPSRSSSNFNVDVNLGNDVLEFYTQFARSSSPAYAWNKEMHYSIDAFYEGDLAMMLNYSWHMETLRSKNAKLNFATANIPQLAEKLPVNYANYWSFVVNKNKEMESVNENDIPVSNKERVHEAWEFLKFATFKNSGSFDVMSAKSGTIKPFPVSIDPAKSYVEKTNKPAARRDLIEVQKSDPYLGAFAYGNLIAKSWHRKDAEAIEGIWAEIIDSVNKGDVTASEAFNLARNRINDINK